MGFSRPKRLTWWIALILAAAGVLFNIVKVPFLSELSFWMVVASAAILLIASKIRAI